MSFLVQVLRPLVWTFGVTVGYVALALMLAGIDGGTNAAVSERVVADRMSGLAIYGVDPVAYFTDGDAVEGHDGIEASYAGVTWRFANDGNRQAFMAHPQVYAPRFGGYDPVAMAGGAPVPGHPSLWMVHGQKLYLFHSKANLDRFRADPDKGNELAVDAWPKVQHMLVP